MVAAIATILNKIARLTNINVIFGLAHPSNEAIAAAETSIATGISLNFFNTNTVATAIVDNSIKDAKTKVKFAIKK